MIDYKKKYEEAIKELRDLHRDYDNISTLVNIKEELERIFPELKSEDERIRTALIEAFETSAQLEYDIQKEGLTYKEVVAYLERQKPTIDETSYQVGIKRVLNNPESYGLVRKEDGGRFYNMLQWTGDNLKEVVHFTGKSPKFDEWFKTWEDFENYVHSHNNIFKIFNEDGSHYEVPVGAWIVRTPDGYNVPSKFTFKQKSKEWTEEDQRILKEISHYCFSHTDNAEWYNWLISLSNPQTRPWKHIDEEVYVKEPVIAQKKNKTDMFGGYVLCADAILNPKTYERYIKVDDIVIQPHWKPTEEQMNAVFEAYYYTSNKDREKTLRELHSDLQKL